VVANVCDSVAIYYLRVLIPNDVRQTVADATGAGSSESSPGVPARAARVGW